jgi:hypothetical protein
MKILRESIALTGNEVDDLVRYPLSKDFDTQLATVISYDVVRHQAHIKKWLESMTEDWNRTGSTPGEWAEDDDLPREKKNFNAFVKRGKRLKAREASLILRYINDKDAEKRAEEHIYRVQRHFAEEIAMVSLLQVAHHTEAADFVPVLLLPVYREVQPMKTREHARQAWIRAVSWQSGFPQVVTKAYWHELKRKEHEENAGTALANAFDLAEAYDFSLADSMRSYLEIE